MKKILALIFIVSSLLNAAYGMSWDCPGFTFLLACEVNDWGGFYNVNCQCVIKGFERELQPNYKVYKECTNMNQFPRCYHNNNFSPEILCNCYNA